MNTRRIPFQFSTTDPLARQRELEKRFGLQPTCPKMYVDVNNPLSMGTIPKETSSPRLQHRVPIFAEGYDQPIHSSSVDSMASVPDKKPNVRVIPIEVEGVDSRSPRHRTYSGPADTLKDRCDNLASERDEAFPFKRFNFENVSKPLKTKHNAEPRVYNIPIQVEGANNVSKYPNTDAVPKPKSVPSAANGCSQSKSSNKVKSPKNEMQSEPNENKTDQSKRVEISLKKIEDILTEFKTYETGVAEFTGTSKDKQYRYLDEMLTRCMLRLDDIDTMGNEEIRLSRKNAVKKIQASIDLLESKANPESISTEISQMQSTPEENDIVEKADCDVEMQDNEISNTVDSTKNENAAENKDVALTMVDNNDLCIVSDDSKIKATEMTLKEELNDATDVEMYEIKEKTSDENNSACETGSLDVSSECKTVTAFAVPNEAEDVTQSKENSTSPLQQKQNSMPEIEMSEGINSDKVNSGDIQSSMLSESDNSADQNVSSKTLNDVEMLDEKNFISNSVEKSNHETKENKLSEMSEMEMVEVQDTTIKEATKQSEIKEKVTSAADCLGQKSSCNVDINMQINSVLPNDKEVTDLLPNVLDTVHTGGKCIPDLSDQGIKSASNYDKTKQ